MWLFCLICNIKVVVLIIKVPASFQMECHQIMKVATYCATCKKLYLGSYRTASKQPAVGLSCCCYCFAAEMDNSGFRPFNSVSSLRKLPASLGWLDWSTKTQAVKVYNVVKRSHVGQRSKDNAKYTVITVYGQRAGNWNCRWTPRWFADWNFVTCISMIFFYVFVCWHKGGCIH